MKAWHFLREDGRLNYEPHTKVRIGKTLKAKGDIALCANGMHASKRLIDALGYAPGPIICRVEVNGEIHHDKDKLVARERTVLWMLDATKLLHTFACRVAEDALKVANVTDERCWNAINTKLKWLRGEATDKELDAAAAWARDAARAAAWDAAWAAARAAARDAARDAARAAAWARDAARAAAWDAARDAARAAAGAAAWDAAWDAQNRRLTSMVIAEHKKQGS